MHFKVAVSQIFHNLPIRNNTQSSQSAFSNITIRPQRGHIVPSTKVENLQQQEQTGRVASRSADLSAVQGFNGEEMEAGRPYQTNAGDAGVVCDVGDVQDFSFVVTACLCTCGGQQEGELQARMRTKPTITMEGCVE